jgi:hypothetical protein
VFDQVKKRGIYISLLRHRLVAFLLAMTLVSAFSGCSKTPDTPTRPEDLVIQNLVGMGNRIWFIRQLYLNGTMQTLTAAQSKYWKSYTVALTDPDSTSGTFADSDGYRGVWDLKSVTSIDETILNQPSGAVPVPININKLDAHTMDVQYIANGSMVRIVYYAN